MRVSRFLLGTVFLAMAGCATKPPASDPAALAEYNDANDPYEPANRFFYKVNDGIDTYFLRPVAVAYRDYVPGAVRRPLRRVLRNISTPAAFGNDVLQGHPRKAGDMMMRFLINSTAGVGGVFDFASDWGYPDHDTDFGLTLAVWGFGEGPFLFLPILGPSDPRDTVGFGGQIGLDPLTYASFGGYNTLQYSRLGSTAVDTREKYIDQIDSVKKTALDPYATFRSLFRQSRVEEERQAKTDRPATVPAWFIKRDQ